MRTNGIELAIVFVTMFLVAMVLLFFAVALDLSTNARIDDLEQAQTPVAEEQR